MKRKRRIELRNEIPLPVLRGVGGNLASLAVFASQVVLGAHCPAPAVDSVQGDALDPGGPQNAYWAKVRQDRRVIPVIVLIAPSADAWLRQTLEALGVGEGISKDGDGVEGPTIRAATLTDAIFRDDGDYWTIAYRGKTRQLNEMKGFHYVVHLLRHAGREFSAIEVLAAAGVRPDDLSAGTVDPETDGLSVVTDLGNAGEVIDDQAAHEYARRLHDLREQLADLQEQLQEATRRNDLGRHDAVREKMETVLHEIDFIARQLAEAGRVGRGRKTGCGRKAASHQERARQIVSKNIKAALEKIGTSHPNLAHNLATHIRTGRTCVYTPDPEHPISWVL